MLQYLSFKNDCLYIGHCKFTAEYFVEDVLANCGIVIIIIDGLNKMRIGCTFISEQTQNGL